MTDIFSGELQAILNLLRDHQEWRFTYPEKYETVRTTAIHQFIDLLSSSVHQKIPHVFTAVPIENLQNASRFEAAKIAGKVRRDLHRMQMKCRDQTKKEYILKIENKWLYAYEQLKSKA